MNEFDNVNPFDAPRQTSEPEPTVLLAPGPTGIGGWLVLVLIGLGITLVAALVALVTIHAPLVLNGSVAELMDSASANYQPLLGWLVICEIVSNLVMVALAGAGLLLMFTKSRKFPKVMIAFYLAKVLIFIANSSIAVQIPDLDDEVLTENTRQLGFSVIACFIWIPYMLVSKRVKNTFTR